LIVKALDFPTGHFQVICADPPWHFKSNSAAAPGRNALSHYACMSLADIAALPVQGLAAPSCALFMWITGPLLAIGAHLPIMKAWGFKPSGMGFVWIKLNPRAATLFLLRSDLAMGGGFTTRKNAEFCVIGKRGPSVRRDASVHEVIISPRREHSRKPDEFFQRIERYAAGPYVELFSREQRQGWTCWGDESGKYNAKQLGTDHALVR
jgi:N6-adenosine-specific RNA methylase IME4